MKVPAPAEKCTACARMGWVSRIACVSGRLRAGKSSLAAPLAAELAYSPVTKGLAKKTLHDALYVPGRPAGRRRTLITVDTTRPVDVASVAAEVRRLLAGRNGST